jgi:hypothetical protein
MKIINKTIFIFLFFAFAVSFYAADRRDVKDKRIQSAVYKITAETGNVGDSYVMKVNNLTMPMNSRGIIAAVDTDDEIAGGQFAGHVFGQVLQLPLLLLKTISQVQLKMVKPILETEFMWLKAMILHLVIAGLPGSKQWNWVLIFMMGTETEFIIQLI